MNLKGKKKVLELWNVIESSGGVLSRVCGLDLPWKGNCWAIYTNFTRYTSTIAPRTMKSHGPEKDSRIANIMKISTGRLWPNLVTFNPPYFFLDFRISSNAHQALPRMGPEDHRWVDEMRR